jgi:hypothetical protein
MYIVTVKFPRDPDHDPKNKQTGACPVSEHCTDVTGQHHSFLAVTKADLELAKATYEHITRIERV